MREEMYKNVHEEVSRQLQKMERERKELLATSPYACRFEKVVKETFPEEDDVFVLIDPLSLWVTVWGRQSYNDVTPVLRELRKQGWEVVAPEEGGGFLFEKTDRGFKWKLIYEVRAGLSIEATLNLYVKMAEKHDGKTCQRIKVGERKEEKVVDIYEVVCPQSELTS